MEPKRMSIKEFRKQGYLQELNRRFLHPLGLALEVIVEDDGSERLGGIWDYRDDPEGMRYDKIDQEKADNIKQIIREKHLERYSRLGYVRQPDESLQKLINEKANSSIFYKRK